VTLHFTVLHRNYQQRRTC